MAYPKGAPHPKLVGDRSTAMVLARLLEIYEVVLLPFGENQRYDLVIDSSEGFVRVQCKTGRLDGGVIRFAACSNNYHHPNRSPDMPYPRHYRGAADMFGVYCPDNDKTYLVPVADIGKRAGTLRLEPTLNNQAQRISGQATTRLFPRACIRGGPLAILLPIRSGGRVGVLLRSSNG